MPLLSIVITVYNKEKFLEKCLGSCLNQRDVRESDYEVLAVNDGSTDGSSDILRNYQKKYGNLFIMDQVNQGLSEARNNGAMLSKGDYVWFVDGDDVITEDAVSILCQAIRESSADVLPIYAKTDGIDQIRNRIPTNVMNGRDVLCSEQWQSCAPFYICKRSFIETHKLKFYPGIYHEDNEFTPRMLFYAEKVKMVDSILYIVYRDPSSITQVPRAKRAYDYLTVAERLYDFFYCQNYLVDKHLISVINKSIAIIVNNALGIISYFDKEERRMFDSYVYDKRRIFNAFKNTPLKYRIEVTLFIIMPKRYSSIYKMLTHTTHQN